MDLVCALHLMHPMAPENAPAIAVIGGISVCNIHAEEVIEALRSQQPMTSIIIQALAGEF